MLPLAVLIRWLKRTSSALPGRARSVAVTLGVGRLTLAGTYTKSSASFLETDSQSQTSESI